MQRSAPRILLLDLFILFFFGLFFFYQKNVFAADYFFDDFNGTSIDSTKWDINNLTSGRRWCADDVNNLYTSGVWFDVATASCHGTLDSLPLGNVDVANGEATFSSPVSRAFPYMSSGPPNKFIFPPTGDFAFEIRLKFNSVTLHGTGAVALYWGDTTTLGNNPPKGPDEGLFAIWNDGHTQVRAVLLGQNAFLGTTFDYHKYRLEYRGGKYSVFFDDRLVVGPSSSSVRPTAILIGNPAFAFWNPWDWSDFSIDYVKVEKLDLAPEPFLDLPWDYKGKSLPFTEAALNINSFFDHEYPLLSTGLAEPLHASRSVMIYKGPPRSTEKYSRHDGYDYGRNAKVKFKVPVLAAADGLATLRTSTGGCGHMILIDHENGFQTRYCHLYDKGFLVATDSAHPVRVNQRDQIGEVGFTGHVIPEGSSGAHLHFMVIQDKNNDGDFEDNIPDGLVDPFGWQSAEPDPWESYEFFYKGENRIGNKSYYLWTKQINNLDATLTANGGVFNSGRNTVTFPQDATNKNLLLEIISTPIQKISDLISSVGSSVQIKAKDEAGDEVTGFDKPFTLGISFEDFDLTRFLTDSLSIYSSSDGIDWIKEDTNIDLENKTATAEVNHLTYFALMAERVDTQAATTTAQFIGEEGESGHFRSDVSVVLNAVDNEGGLGVDYILYKKDGEDWQEYIAPIQFTDEGKYSIEFYSVDNDENIEEPKSVAFSIDKTPPEAEIYYSLSTKDVQFDGKDDSGSATVTQANAKGNKKIVVSDKAGNTLTILANAYNNKSLSWISFLSLQYNDAPPIILGKNNLFIIPTYNRKTNQLTSLSEAYSGKDKNLIRIVYSVAKDKTTVYAYDKRNKQLLKEELAGMHLLKLYTENATLNYSY